VSRNAGDIIFHRGQREDYLCGQSDRDAMRLIQGDTATRACAVAGPRTRWAAATGGGAVYKERESAGGAGARKSSTAINIKHDVQPRTRDQDQQDQFEDQPSPKDHRIKHIRNGNAAGRETGRSVNDDEHVFVLRDLASDRANRTLKRGSRSRYPIRDCRNRRWWHPSR